MYDVFTTLETYGFTCCRCAAQWQEQYEVRRGRDATGEEVVSYRVRGAPVAAPAGRSCPKCGGLRVRLSPQHGCPHEVAADLPAQATPTSAAG
jgi:hypothetical protein